MTDGNKVSIDAQAIINLGVAGTKLNKKASDRIQKDFDRTLSGILQRNTSSSTTAVAREQKKLNATLANLGRADTEKAVKALQANAKTTIGEFFKANQDLLSGLSRGQKSAFTRSIKDFKDAPLALLPTIQSTYKSLSKELTSAAFVDDKLASKGRANILKAAGMDPQQLSRFTSTPEFRKSVEAYKGALVETNKRFSKLSNQLSSNIDPSTATEKGGVIVGSLSKRIADTKKEIEQAEKLLSKQQIGRQASRAKRDEVKGRGVTDNLRAKTAILRQAGGRANFDATRIPKGEATFLLKALNDEAKILTGKTIPALKARASTDANAARQLQSVNKFLDQQTGIRKTLRKSIKDKTASEIKAEKQAVELQKAKSIGQRKYQQVIQQTGRDLKGIRKLNEADARFLRDKLKSEQALFDKRAKSGILSPKESAKVSSLIQRRSEAVKELDTRIRALNKTEVAGAKERARRERLSSQRLARRQGRDALGTDLSAVSTVSKSQLPASIDFLNRRREALTRAEGIASRQLAAGVSGSSEKLNRLQGSLVEVNRALTVGQKRMKGFTGAVHQAASTIRLFLRYALGYGALYQLLGGVTALVGGLVQLDKSFKSIQAISAATASEMVQVEAAIKRVATTTKFNLAEIAQAAQVLSQAGVEPRQLSSALESVALFAAGTNTALETSADLISTMRNVFKELTDGQIADQLTKAVNISKLTGEDLKTILSRGLQVAKAYNITSEQFLGATAILRNAGIKASTVSTGLRQSILELLSPDSKTIAVLRQRYTELGENLSDEQIKSKFFAFGQSNNPLLAVLTELKRLGATGSAKKLFGRIFDVRAENVIKVLADNLEGLNEATAKIGLPGGAAAAADKQMESLANRMSNLGAVVLSLADNLSGGLIDSLSDATKSFTDFLKTVNDGIINLKAKTGEGAGGGVFASLLAGTSAGLSTQGGVAKRFAVGAATAATGGLAVAGNAATGAISPGVLASIIALSSVVIPFFGNLGKALASSKSAASALSRSKTLGKKVGKLSFLRPIFAFLRALVGGPVAWLLTLGTIAATFGGLFSGSDKLATKLEALSQKLEEDKVDLEKAEAELKDFDPTQSGGFASKVTELQNSLEGYQSFVDQYIGDLTDQRLEDAKKVIEELGSSSLDKGAPRTQELFKQLERLTGKAIDEAERSAAQTQFAGLAEQRALLNATVQGLAENAQVLLDSDLNNPDNRKRLDAIQRAFDEASGGVIPRTIEGMLKLLDVYQRIGKESSLAAVREASQQKQQSEAQRSNAVFQSALSSSITGERSSTGSLKDLRAGLELAISKEATPELAARIAGLQQGASSSKRQNEFAQSQEDGITASLFRDKPLSLDATTQSLVDYFANGEATELFAEQLEAQNAKLIDTYTGYVSSINELLADPKQSSNIREIVRARGLSLKDGKLDVPQADLFRRSPTKLEGAEFLEPTSLAKSLAEASRRSVPFGRSESKPKRRSTLQDERALVDVDSKIAEAERAENLEEANKLLVERQVIERRILQADIDYLRARVSQSVDKDSDAAQKKLDDASSRMAKLRADQAKALKAANDKLAIKKLDDERDAVALALDKTKRALGKQIPGTEEYTSLLEQQNQQQKELLGLDSEKTEVTRELTETEKKRLEFEKSKLDADLRREEIQQQLDKLQRDVDVASRETSQQAGQRTSGIPQSDAQRVQQLEKEATPLSAQEAALTSQIRDETKRIDEGGGDPKRLQELQDQLHGVRIRLAEINAEKDDLTASGSEQVYKGLDPTTLKNKLEQVNDSFKNLGDNISDSIVGALDSVGDAFFNAVHKGENFFDSLKNVARTTLLEISRLIIKAGINRLLTNALGGDLLGGGSATPTSSGGSAGQSQQTGLFGGIVSAATGGGKGNTSGVDALNAAAARAAVSVSGMAGAVNPTSVKLGGLGAKADEAAEGTAEAATTFSGTLGSIFTDLQGSLGGLFNSFKGLFSGFLGGGGGGQSTLGFLASAAVSSFAGGAATGGLVESFAGGGSVDKSGIIRGKGTGTSDSVPAAVVGPDGKFHKPILVSNKEAILTAKAVQTLGPEFIKQANSGRIQGFANGGMVGQKAKAAPGLDSLKGSLDNLSNQPQTPTKDRIVNVLDPSLVQDYLSSSEGERVVLNILRRNPNAIGRR